ncbi:hypothetical protein P153DRAFT_423570 [Dothidotthia symphoricarpi CBS 119687]|uniref:WSC domain-containing protein n=1 Tax=Dothidotthia symphoricarpi CBS 119687 TaxID=1392245 RepID=A0A6A6A8M4_9PLEO|nr:uncharacterized protein P153DRAFT_423570 [Dothidotthia symphoricarpi CBS 119687]KAF2128322.1 hypothetical protein P153DRAFT_423570 [Dothidotthia symphoricarpi CBS 119687]
MKTSTFLSLVVLARQVTSTRYPELQWDPDTAKDCVEWYNNGDGVTCDAVRDLIPITPEQFHKWNPSVGLDCKPWNYQSYCIATAERLNNTPKQTTPSSTIATTTTSAFTLGPSPTAWTDRGCYVEDTELPLLDQNISPIGGVAFLTILACKNSCYLHAYSFAGVQEGNQCWCGSSIRGELAKNQTDCNIPCSGNEEISCGGKGLLNIFQAEKNETSASTTTTSTSTGVQVASASLSKTSEIATLRWR